MHPVGSHCLCHDLKLLMPIPEKPPSLVDATPFSQACEKTTEHIPQGMRIPQFLELLCQVCKHPDLFSSHNHNNLSCHTAVFSDACTKECGNFQNSIEIDKLQWSANCMEFALTL